MASALETLCGQAVGAEQFEMLGIYMQRSWVITSVTALAVTPIFVFTAPLLKLLHQSSEISELAGKYAIWVIPQVYAYAVNFPVQKFLQAQSKMWVMTTICVVMLGFHVLFNWILVSKLGHGLLGAAIAGNISWWIMVLAQLAYVVSGFFPDAWTGFSLLAFKSLSSFVKLSLASAFMVCLELWYPTVLILMVGRLNNPKISVDAVSICMNFQFWTMMVFLGFGTAVSVRVSNELGAGRSRAAKFSVVVAVVTSTSIGIVFTVLILAFKGDFPKLFSGNKQVIREASKLGYFLTGTVFLNSIQPVLYGVAVGAGWQLSVALVNAGSYYAFGLPLGALLGYKYKLGAQGIWTGILAGCLLQTIALIVTVLRANWQKEVVQAEERVRSHAMTASPVNGNGTTENDRDSAFSLIR